VSDLVAQHYSFKISPDMPSGRLDLFMARQNLGLTRNQIQKLLEAGHIKLNGHEAKAAYKIRVGDCIEIEIPAPASLETKPEAIPLEILYQDKHVALIDKPAGLVVHASAGHSEGTLVNALLYHLKDLSGIGGKLRPGIVHRLDKDTSGIMLVAKNNRAHAELVRMFQNREIQKTYLALAYGSFKQDSGMMQNKLGRSRGNRKKISSKTQQGKEAKTSFKVLKRFSNMALLEVKPHTGRTHQIRVHLAESGHPVVGDAVYGGRQWIHKLSPALQGLVQKIKRQMLHAQRLEFVHPVSGKKIKGEASLPSDFQKILQEAQKEISN